MNRRPLRLALGVPGFLSLIPAAQGTRFQPAVVLTGNSIGGVAILVANGVGEHP